MSSYRKLAITLPLLLLFISCEVVDTYVEELHDIDDHNEETHIEGENHDDKSIFEITGENDDFSIFAEAVAFTGLEDTLDANNQITLFAPFNDAFEALFESMGVTSDEFFVDENRELLQEILNYHIASGKRFYEDITVSEQIRTHQSSFIYVSEDEGQYYVGNEKNGFARLVETDISAANGVIHVINSVLLPGDLQIPGNQEGSDQDDNSQDHSDNDDSDNDPGQNGDEEDHSDDNDSGQNGQDNQEDSDGNENNDESESDSREEYHNQTILEITADRDEFSIFTEAISFTGIDADLDGNRQYTVFAPINAAFSGLLENLGLTADEFFIDENRDLIKDILLYHITPGNRSANNIESSDRINTLHKNFLFIQNIGGNILVGNTENGFATVTAADIEASNGVIHVIDRVLVP